MFLTMPDVARAAPAAASAQEAKSLLSDMQSAARKLDYSGVFMYQQGEIMQSSRLVHILDGTGERERLEILDGRPREYLRHNDMVQCLLPDTQTVLLEQRRGDSFPGLLLGDPENLLQHYNVYVDANPKRVAGRQCRWIMVEPRDQLRYGYRLCADVETNLLLKAQTLNSHQTVIEQVSFSSLRIGVEVDKNQLVTRWPTRDWELREPTVTPVDLAAQGWRIPAPAGFAAVFQVSRSMEHSASVNQLVLSDGLAAISVFIEPYDNQQYVPVDGHVRHGATNVYATRIADFWLMAVGEVPAVTLEQLAKATEFVPVPNPK